METENAQLRNESTKLRQQATDVQEISHDRIDDYLKQLENANLRVTLSRVTRREGAKRSLITQSGITQTIHNHPLGGIIQ